MYVRPDYKNSSLDPFEGKFGQAMVCWLILIDIVREYCRLKKKIDLEMSKNDQIE